MSPAEERLALLSSIRKIRHSQLATLTFINDSLLEDEEMVKEYFDSPFGSLESEKIETIFAGAAANSVLRSKVIPEKQKASVAKIQAHAVVEMLRYGKLDYQYATDKIYAKTYNKLLKENDVAQRVTNIQKTRNFLIRKGGKVAISSGMAALAHAAAATAATGLAATLSAPVVVGLATYGVLTYGSKLIPKKIKEPIKKKYDDIQKRVFDTAVTAVKGLAQRMEPIAEKVKPVIEEAKTTMYQVRQAVKRAASNAWEKTKNVGKKILSFFGF